MLPLILKWVSLTCVLRTHAKVLNKEINKRDKHGTHTGHDTSTLSPLSISLFSILTCANKTHFKSMKKKIKNKNNNKRSSIAWLQFTNPLAAT